MTDIDGAIEFLELALHHNENRLSTQMENVLSRINYLRSEQLEGMGDKIGSRHRFEKINEFETHLV